MATNQDRGTKRTCQNGECSARFYDLNRNPIICPICGSKYAIAHSPAGAVAAAEERAQRKVKKPEYEAETREAEAEDPLADVETDDAEDTVADEADETFLEEEEDDGNVSDIVGGPVDGEEEP